MKAIKHPSRVSDRRQYLLRKRSLWYRPNAQGYTEDLAEAGVYSAKETRARLDGDGVTAVSTKNMRGQLWREVQEHLRKAAALSELAQRI